MSAGEGKADESKESSNSTRRMEVFDQLESKLLNEYLFGERSKEFFRRWLPAFRGVDPAGEQRFEFMDAFRDYSETLEGTLAEFLAMKGISREEFHRMCELALQERDGKEDDARMFVDMLLALTEYETFVRMMAKRAGFEYGPAGGAGK